MQDYFRLTVCQNKNILTITPSRPGQAQENSINVTWTSPTGLNRASLEYKATSTDPSGTIVPSSWSADPHYYFMNLTPGTVYTISVTTQTQSNPGYGTGTVEHKGPDVNIYTKPAQPGSLSSANSEGGNVTVEFTPSAGRVESYTVIVTKDGTTTNASNVTVAKQKVSAFFVGLTPGEHYNVTMTAFSGNIPSKSRTGNFRVSAQQAGEVFGGKLISNGSRWVQISWTKPLKPNGEIMGYTVQLRSDNGSCSSGVAVRCDACHYNSTM
ncbi:tenascin-N-like, partial [Littorina saxatilis]|uniref:tenascin-N-like n=1 Tax=Littorina saxatilis TaxID=31220 RepID=UPI0038B57F7F